MQNKNLIWQDPLCYIACGFGLGSAPKAPGTFGTIAALPFYYVLSHYSWHMYAIAIILFTLIGFYITDVVAKTWRDVDPHEVVWDEVVGYLITLFLIPCVWYWILIGFILFRFFDIYKPYPINLLNNIPNGFGIMLDDILAGVYALILLHLIIWMI